MQEQPHIEITWTSLDTETTGNLMHRTRAQVRRLCEDGDLGALLESAHGLHPAAARHFYDQLFKQSMAQIDAASAEPEALTLRLSLPAQTARMWLSVAELVYQLLIDPKAMSEAGDVPLTSEEASMMANMLDVARSTILARRPGGAAFPSTTRGSTTSIPTAATPEADAWHEIELLKRMFEDAPLGMGLVDTRLRVIAANPALCRMLGYERDEILEANLADVALAEDTDIELMRKVLAGEVPHARFLTCHTKRDASELWLGTLATMVRDSSGNPSFGIVIIEEARPEAVAVSSAATRRLASMTDREREILTLMCEGLGTAEIAGRLFLSRRTVETHAHKAYRKLGVRSRSEALSEFLRLTNPTA